jgi:hypothetical protein
LLGVAIPKKVFLVPICACSSIFLQRMLQVEEAGVKSGTRRRNFKIVSASSLPTFELRTTDPIL